MKLKASLAGSFVARSFLGVFAAGFCFLQAAEPMVRTTSIAPAKSDPIEQGEDSAIYRCAGLSGYEVFRHEAHGRSWIELVFADESFDLLPGILAVCPGNFPSLADDQVYWRGYEADGVFTPQCLIVRIKSLLDDGGEAQTFVIVQTAQGATRVVGHSPGESGLAAAEKRADQLCGN